jgi:NADH:ubiquinone oxidoreductase subunit 5 (subunit L)/multisubunit Na+/H+ antiporter MnhA subunit
VKIQSNYSWKAISKLNLDYATVFSLAPYMNENVVTIIGICLLIGAMAKSSQVGLHVWLPMAIPLQKSQMVNNL